MELSGGNTRVLENPVEATLEVVDWTSPNCIRDIRREPIHLAGYCIGYKRGVDRKWHASVRMHPVEYNQLKSYRVVCRMASSTTAF